MPPATVDLGDWQEQWARVRRWHKGLAPIRARLPVDVGREEAIDTVLAFFMVCHHLGDAIHQSGLKTKAEVTAYVKTSLPLRLCRDICIALKHFEITDPWMPMQTLSTATISLTYVGTSQFLTTFSSFAGWSSPTAAVKTCSSWQTSAWRPGGPTCPGHDRGGDGPPSAPR